VESLSLWTGLRSLLLVAALFYAASWLLRSGTVRSSLRAWAVSRPAT
jgi:hypothetical protein